MSEDQEYIAPSNTLYQPASVMEGQWNKEQGKDRMVLQEAGGMSEVEARVLRHREGHTERTKYPAYCSNSAPFRHSARTRAHTHTHTHTHTSMCQGEGEGSEK